MTCFSGAQRGLLSIAGALCIVVSLSVGDGALAQAKKSAKASPAKSSSAAAAKSVAFVAPPRTISDITALLDQQKPDEKAMAQLNADAERSPPAGLGGGALAKFLYDRANARALIGRSREAIADYDKAIEVGRGTFVDVTRIKNSLQSQLNYTGQPERRLRLLLELASELATQGRRAGVYRQLAETYIQLGDLRRAENYVRLNESKIVEARAEFGGYSHSGEGWEAQVAQGRGRIQELQGRYQDAEASFRRAQAFYVVSARKWTITRDGGSPRSGIELQVDVMQAFQGRAKARQGRYAEGEADVRRALISRLQKVGKYNLTTAQAIGILANILAEQGRFEDAEKLILAELDIYKTLGVEKDSQPFASGWNRLATILNLAGRWKEASEAYARLDDATRNWEPARREILTLDVNQIAALYNSNNLDAGIAAAQRLVARRKAQYGDQNVETALARGMLAIGLAKAERSSEAMREFNAAIPVLLNSTRETDSDDAIGSAAREQRLQIVIESYVAVMAKGGGSAEQIANDTFPLGELVRGRAVQKALAASSARLLATDPALAQLARKEQDLEKNVAASVRMLNNALSVAPKDRDEKNVRELMADVEQLRSQRVAARREIEQKFPTYAQLVDPKPPAAADVRAVLGEDEALVSFYFGRETSFVWAVSKGGAVAFAVLPLNAGELEAKVAKLREALDPQAALVSDIPPFDLALGHDLYKTLLAPVEAGWKNAKSLVVVTNGALGLLPLSLLPTAPAQLPATEEVLFAGYRSVPWLARTHAVTMVPSAAALRTLRALPPGNAQRKDLIAFGDPLFSKDQEREAAQLVQVAASSADKPQATPGAENLTRGLPLKRRNAPQLGTVNSADLAMLPRLPDTADELKSIALALKADPTEVLNLGKDANERRVRTMDLSGFRILAFATHGLVPGELNGLTQPALALSSPDVAGSAGDGLLTMEDILALKLDADWVVLSACNTGAAQGAGAEAASGLGRAFFYAGTRALLVTNWSVHSQSARELVTDLFKRQAEDATLTRGAALQRAMMAMVDGPGYQDAQGKTEFAYAHPLFWAPYTIIGDGGKR